MNGLIWPAIAQARQGPAEEAEAPPAGFLKGAASRCRYYLAADFPPFRGHFEGQPVLPALVQVLLAKDAARTASGRELKIAAVIQAKFLAVVSPGSRLTVYAQAGPAGGAEDWRFHLRHRPDGAASEADAAFLRLKMAPG